LGVVDAEVLQAVSPTIKWAHAVAPVPEPMAVENGQKKQPADIIGDCQKKVKSMAVTPGLTKTMVVYLVATGARPESGASEKSKVWHKIAENER